MWKARCLALACCLLLPASAHALELKNLRTTYGPTGAPHKENKFLAGDVVCVVYDIVDLKIDADTGFARYLVSMEIFDGKGERIFNKDTPVQRYASLGGTSMPGFATVVMGTDQKPGKYSMKITVIDRNSTDKATKSINFPFELLPADFGLIHLEFPAVALTNTDFVPQCLLVGMALDSKKMPNVDVTMRILDESGKPTLKKAFVLHIPKDLDKEIDIKGKDYLPIPFPLFLNRPGNFTIELEAVDNNGKKTFKKTIPLKVIDPTSGK
jgi:hypothetical protein